jgi:hypothetical protein
MIIHQNYHKKLKKEDKTVLNRPFIRFFKVFSLLFLISAVGYSYSERNEISAVDDSQKILPEKERARVMNEWLEWRLDNIIPKLMRREGIDMWLVINREYNEDPVYMSLVPEPTMYARRTSILIFHDRGEKLGVQRLSCSENIDPDFPRPRRKTRSPKAFREFLWYGRMV